MPIDEIKARNYNLDIKNPNAEDPSHGDPVELLAALPPPAGRDRRGARRPRDELAAALEGQRRQ